MNLRRKLTLAALPALLVLAGIGWHAAASIELLGHRVEHALERNYESIRAARAVRDVIDDLERLLLTGTADDLAALEGRLETFHAARARQRANVMEEGEEEVTRRFEAACDAWLAAIRETVAAPPGPERVRRFVEQAQARAQEVRVEARLIATLNQDALQQQSRETIELAGELRREVIGVSAGALAALLLVGVVVAGRMSRPVAELTVAVRRVGEGDLDQALPEVKTRDEVGALAEEVRRMVGALRAYRRSSLGELVAAQQLAQAAIDSLREPVISFGPDGRVRQVNDAARAVGIDPAGEEPLGPLPPELRRAIEEARDDVLAGRGPVVPEGLERAVSVLVRGAARNLQVHAMPTASSTAGVGIVGATALVRDVTSLHAAAALKDDLLSTVAHELRTPLTSLRMAVYLCLEQVVGPLTDRQHELLVGAREDAERLHALVEGILAVSRIEGGGLAARRQPVPLSELVEAAVAPARVPAADRRVALSCDGAPAVACDVDRESAALALGNLVQNALRHTPEGGCVTVTAAVEGGWARLEVRDTGPGIAPEHRPRLFSRFYRVPGSPSGGTGLGLSIARDVVHAHGGEIGVESQVGQGSTFWFTLPLAADGTGAR